MSQAETLSIKSIFCLCLISTAFGLASPVKGQIIPDNTLSTETSRLNQNQIINGALGDKIEGGATRGSNLFHSFSEFNIQDGQRVYFVNPAGVENILTRVTGKNASNIFGTLGVLGTSNLFLINPNGILFGSNAQLDVQGSFSASTANNFKFTDGNEFSATTPEEPPQLSINVPLGLQTGSIPAGSVLTNRANLTAGQDLSLGADQLDLQGQLVAGGDLRLAANTVIARDSINIPFVASAGSNLLVQGNQGIDIAVLSHPNSGLFAGGNLVLRSNGTVGGNTHFRSGGSFRTERLNGSLGNLSSSRGSIILTNGDVALGDYIGASLHILAGGSVSLGNVTITETGDTGATINLSNTTLFNSSKTYADLANFNLTEYKATPNSDGSVRSVDPVAAPIAINGSTQATLDVRTGVDWTTLGGLQTSSVASGSVAPAPTATGTASSADIILNGNIQVAQPGGLVLLTNQFRPNALPGTISIRGNVDTSTSVSEVNGGDIRVYGRGDIMGNPVNPISLNSNFLSLDGEGKGGDISLFSNVGNISLRVFMPFPGSGGDISLSTNVGNISVTNSNWSAGFRGNVGSFSVATNIGNISLKNSGLSVGNTGDGGSISFAANIGDISLENASLYSYSYWSSASGGGNAGNGGNISFFSNSGNISLTNGYLDLYSEARLNSGNSGNGGAVSFATNSGNISLNNMQLRTHAQSGSNNSRDGGAISFFTRSGDISLKSSLANSYSFSAIGTAGNGGSISAITQSGNVSLENSFLSSTSTSNTGTAGNGGSISVSTRSGNIFLKKGASADFSPSLSSYSFSNTGNAGNGGTINLSAAGGTIFGSSNLLNSFSVSSTASSGNGGNVTLAASREISGLAVTTTASNGLAGSVEVIGLDDLRVVNTNLQTAQQVKISLPLSSNPITINLSDLGRAANVAAISEGSLTFSNSTIASDTNGGNPAGDITFKANQGITIADSSNISARSSSGGKAGNITFEAPTLVVAGDARVLAETTSTGDSGSIFVNAPTSVNLIRQDNLSPVLSVETSGAGKAGNITINTNSLNLSEQASITATATANATNPRGGGSITINASNLNLAGIVGIFAETKGEAPAGTLQLNPYNNQPDLDIALTPNSKISASTSGSGKGGDLIVTAPQSITIAGSGKLAVETSNIGNAGNMNFTTQQLTLKDGVEISASTSGIGKAGEISINAEKFTLSGGAKVSTNTSSSGSAGNLTVQVNDQLFLTGRGTGLFATTTDNSTGIGGNIIIDPRLVQIEDGATIAVDSRGSGIGGNISLQASRLVLNQQGSITAKTASTTGGNISLNVKDLTLLRRNSLISASAGTDKAGGNGGNINFDGKFIIALENENSDISADAFSGTGGNIQINSQGIFGIESRPKLTAKSDITASSELGISGTVNLNQPDNSSIQNSFTELSPNVIDTNALIANSCIARGAKREENTFTITGSGALRNSPGDALISAYTTGDVRNVEPTSRPWKKGDPIVEPQGLYRLPSGQLLLSRACN